MYEWILYNFFFFDNVKFIEFKISNHIPKIYTLNNNYLKFKKLKFKIKILLIKFISYLSINYKNILTYKIVVLLF